MIEVYACKIPKDFSNDFEPLLQYVSTSKKERIKRYRNIKDAYRTLLADVLIRSLIREKLLLRNEEIIYEYNSFGKPILKGERDFSFNVSHSGEWIVCAISNLPVGIDIEQMSLIDINIAKRFFSEKENADLENKKNFEQKNYFYELWTLKESYIKCLGKGLSIPLNSFVIAKNNENRVIVKQNHSSKSFFFHQYVIDEDYKLAVCATTNNFSQNVKIKTIRQVIGSLKS